MTCVLLSAIMCLLPLATALGDSVKPKYISVAFHDVVDQRGGASDSVTAANLISFFEWLRGNGWTAITLDDIERARSGVRQLPNRSILITFDDGYRSLYTRVYPLLLAYRIPTVAALVGSWMEGPKREPARIGDDLIPGSKDLITWDEAREMAQSGLVEFASHSYDLHFTHLATPWGGELPAAATLAYDTVGGYESETAYRRRIRADLERSRALLQKELGIAPRALAWPFGRYTKAAEQEALAAKYEFMLTMDSEAGFPEDLPRVPRLYPIGDPDLRSMVANLANRQPAAVRIVRLDPATLSPTDPAGFEKALGAAIERVRVLGTTTVVVDAAASGPHDRVAAWFPNRVLPMKADLLSRIVWQMHTRAGVQVVVSLPVSAARAAADDDEAVIRLFEDLGYSVLADGLLLDQVPALAATPAGPSDGTMSWDIRHKRNSLDVSRLPAGDALALRAFFAFERGQPGRRLFLLTQSIGLSPSAVADATLIEAPLAEKPFRQVVNRLVAAGWLTAPNRYRCGIWINAEKPPSAASLSADVRLFQRRGGVAFGWEPDNPAADQPKATLAAPNVSAASFPVRF